MSSSERPESAAEKHAETNCEFRSRTERELRGRADHKDALARLALTALRNADIRRFADELVKVVAEVLDVEYCKILELLPDGSGLLMRAGVGWSNGTVGDAVVGVGLDSQAGYTLISTEPVVVENLQEERRFHGPSLLRDHGVVSGISARICPAGGLFGVLGAHSVRRRVFTADEIQFVRDVAEVLCATLEREREERGVKAALDEQTTRAWDLRRRFALLAEANALVSASRDHLSALESLARLAVPQLADWCFFDVVEEGGRYTGSSWRMPIPTTKIWPTSCSTPTR